MKSSPKLTNSYSKFWTETSETNSKILEMNFCLNTAHNIFLTQDYGGEKDKVGSVKDGNKQKHKLEKLKQE